MNDEIALYKQSTQILYEKCMSV